MCIGRGGGAHTLRSYAVFRGNRTGAWWTRSGRTEFLPPIRKGDASVADALKVRCCVGRGGEGAATGVSPAVPQSIGTPRLTAEERRAGLRAREACAFGLPGASAAALAAGRGLCWAVGRVREWQLLLSPLTLLAGYVGARLGRASLRLAERT